MKDMIYDRYLGARASVYAMSLLAALSFLPRTSSANTWLANPTSNDWDTAANWSDNQVPGYLDGAFFEQSSQTQVSITSGSEVLSIIFQADASPYEIALEPGTYLELGGSTQPGQGGVMNDSGIVQNFLCKSGDDGAGSEMDIGGNAGELALFTTEPQQTVAGGSGSIWVVGKGSGGEATFVNNGGVVSGGSGGQLYFFDVAKADRATIDNEAGTTSGASGGVTIFWSSSSARGSIISAEGATVSGAAGGAIRLIDQSHAAEATLTAHGGVNGGAGGLISFEHNSTGGRTHVEVFGNGALDLSAHSVPFVIIGSLEGDGQVLLGGRRLGVGEDNKSTTFAGVIQGTGSLSKVGTGTLTLSGINSYSGRTVVSEGELLVNSSEGSGTGSGLVRVDAGTLGGSGIIAGPVRVGMGSGAGAFLAPGADGVGTLAIQRALQFESDGTYECELDTNTAQADEVTTKRAIIKPGAQFTLLELGNQTLPVGSVFTIIDNRSHQTISGTFANLPDGATITSGGNTYQANYEGGDGNDLTLTVQ